MRIKHNKSVLFFFAVLLILLYNTCSFAQNWIWAESSGSITGSDIGYGVATDNSGNTYTTGLFFSTAYFGGFTLISAGAQDIFIVKYNTAGNVVWAKGLGDSSSDLGSDIVTDSNGNVYVIGSFNGTVNFGNTKLTSLGWYDIFIAKYDSLGNEIWARQAGGDDFDFGNDIDIDSDGNAYVTGSFRSFTITMGNITLNNTSSTIFMYDIAIAKYDTAGNVLWAKQAIGPGDENVTAIEADKNGNVYVLGAFDSTTTFGNITLINNTGDNDIFLTKYDTSGNLAWAKQMGGVNFDAGYGLAIDDINSLYITGYFLGAATFGNTTLTGGGSFNELFLAKYDTSGNDIWVKQVSGAGNNVGTSVETDKYNNVFIACNFYGSSDFGSTTLNSVGSEDIFIGEYDSAGNELWVIQAGGNDFDEVQDITIDNQGYIYATGRFRSLANFGNTSLVSTGGEDVWVAKLQGVFSGIKETSKMPFITVYPNPANNSIVIETHSENSEPTSSYNFTIYDVIGNIVFEKMLSSKLETLNVNLSAGMYFYQVEDKSQNISNGKILVQ